MRIAPPLNTIEIDISTHSFEIYRAYDETIYSIGKNIIIPCARSIMVDITGSSFLIPPSLNTLQFPSESSELTRTHEGNEKIRKNSVLIITELIKNWPKARNSWDLLCCDPELEAHWECANYITVQKLGMNDHGKVHAMVATASALQMLDILVKSGIEPDIISSEMGDLDDAYLIVMIAALCHDIGNEIHRVDHISHSLLIVSPILDRILDHIYDEPIQMTRIKTFILSAIYSHHGDPRPLTIEAGAVCIGDATDMTTGRARTAYDQGSVTIHTISALSIDQVTIKKGDDLPVNIIITMSNSAGLFQVQEILAPKIAAGPLTPYIELKIQLTDESSGFEKQILSGIKLIQGSQIK